MFKDGAQSAKVPSAGRKSRGADVKFEDLPDGSFKFTYQPAILRDDDEGDGWTVERHIGKPAAYLFAWRSGCWQLTQDFR